MMIIVFRVYIGASPFLETAVFASVGITQRKKITSLLSV